jgi:hypothetical protein
MNRSPCWVIDSCPSRLANVIGQRQVLGFRNVAQYFEILVSCLALVAGLDGLLADVC